MSTCRLSLPLLLPAEYCEQATDHWYRKKDGDPECVRLFEGHYSCRQYRDGRVRKLFVGPGYKEVLISGDGRALFVWRNFIDDSGQVGINCAVFRNLYAFSGGVMSSDLIREADDYAWAIWPGERHYTMVNPEKVRSSNPGYCFQKAGWSKCGWTKGGLLILERLAI